LDPDLGQTAELTLTCTKSAGDTATASKMYTPLAEVTLTVAQ